MKVMPVKMSGASRETRRAAADDGRAGGPPQFAVWGLPGADIVFTGNTVRGWRNALAADKATATARDNRVANYGAVGIKLDQPVGKAIITGNIFESDRDKTGFTVSGGEAVVEDNRVERSNEGKP